MRHFVDKGRQSLFRTALMEVRRIQRDLVGDDLAVLRSEPAAGEIPKRRFAPLHGDKAGRRPPISLRLKNA